MNITPLGFAQKSCETFGDADSKMLNGKHDVKAYLLTSEIVQGGHVLPIVDIHLPGKQKEMRCGKS